MASPFFAHHSTSNAANLSPTECASPKARISWQAELYLSLKLLCDLQAGVIVLIQEAKEIVPFRCGGIFLYRVLVAIRNLLEEINRKLPSSPLLTTLLSIGSD